MKTIGRRLPCGHATIHHPLDHGLVRRVCRTCKRVFLGNVERSEASELVGEEVMRVTWSEVQR